MHEYLSRNIDISSKTIDSIESGDVALLAKCMNDAQSSFDSGKFLFPSGLCALWYYCILYYVYKFK